MGTLKPRALSEKSLRAKSWWGLRRTSVLGEDQSAGGEDAGRDELGRGGRGDGVALAGAVGRVVERGTRGHDGPVRPGGPLAQPSEDGRLPTPAPAAFGLTDWWRPSESCSAGLTAPWPYEYLDIILSS